MKTTSTKIMIQNLQGYIIYSKREFILGRNIKVWGVYSNDNKQVSLCGSFDTALDTLVKQSK